MEKVVDMTVPAVVQSLFIDSISRRLDEMQFSGQGKDRKIAWRCRIEVRQLLRVVYKTSSKPSDEDRGWTDEWMEFSKTWGLNWRWDKRQHPRRLTVEVGDRKFEGLVEEGELLIRQAVDYLSEQLRATHRLACSIGAVKKES